MSSQLIGSLLTSRSRPLACAPDAWRGLDELAVRERLAPALAHAVRHDPAVPPSVRQTLDRELYQTGAFNLVLYRELGRILRAKPAAASPVLLKGAALATTVYADPALRPMCDIDLLVRPCDLDAWIRRLKELGYEADGPEMAPGLTRAVHYQLAYRGGAHKDIVIELHWNLVAGDADWRAPDIDWFWEQTEPWPGSEELASAAALQLNPLANLLYLSAHAILQHGGARTRLVWLYDLHLVIERASRRIDWPLAIEKARELQWDAALAEALQRSTSLFGTPVPPAVVDALERDATALGRAHVEGKAKAESSRAGFLWRELACLDRAARMRSVLAIMFPSPSYLKWRYPRAGAFWPLAYLHRWSIVIREGAGLALRRLTRALSFVFL